VSLARDTKKPLNSATGYVLLFPADQHSDACCIARALTATHNLSPHSTSISYMNLGDILRSYASAEPAWLARSNAKYFSEKLLAF